MMTLSPSAITDDIRVRADQLTQLSPRNQTPPVRKVFQAVTFDAQGVGDANRGTRVEFENVVVSKGDPSKADSVQIICMD